MYNRISLICAFVAVLLASALSLQASPARAGNLVAMVSNATGNVAVAPPGGTAFEKAHLLQQLYDGYQVRVDAGGHATLAFVQGGLRVTLAGPVTVRIANNTAQKTAGSGAVTTSQATSRAGTQISADINLARMGGKLSRASITDFHITSDPGFKTLRPTITWQIGKDTPADKFHLTVQDESDSVVVETDLPGTARSYTFQKDLTPGVSYDVSLMAVVGPSKTMADNSGGGQSPNPYRINVISESTAAALDAQRAEAEKQFNQQKGDTTPLVMALVMYGEHDLYTDMLPLAEQIVAVHPDKNVYDMIASIYRHRLELAKADSYEKMGQ
jgi:hypothetical protein